ncbi:MAG: ribonuclease P protein component [Acidobacteria bacterium]|nr:ribonuclease P protein component [Acidobacteriota bacterium]
MTNAPFAPPRSPKPGGYRYPKTNRLLKSADFRKVYDQGSRFSCPYFVAFLLRNTRTTDSLAAAVGEEPSGGGEPQAARALVSNSCEPGPRTAGPRIGFTIPRAVGKSHDRNRIRRRIREMIRVRLASVDPALDIVLNPRRAALEATQADLVRHVERLLERCRA